MRFSFLAALALALFIGGCAADQNPSPAVAQVINDNKLNLVGYDYALAKFNDKSALFIDARPLKRFNAGTIPFSVQIHDAEYKDHISRIAKFAKDKEIIVFCQGFDCVKSANLAAMLQKDGYSNVKLYQAGFPDWASKNYAEIGTEVVKKALDDNSALLIDARPHAKFSAETIPGAISIPDSDADALKGRFPSDKNAAIITFCQGFDCHKSHALAAKLVSMGYTHVSNYSAGMEGWKKAGHKTTKGGENKAAVALSKPFMGPIKKGLDEGTVDGEWFVKNYAKLPKNVKIIDVRKASERANGFVKGSLHVSVEENDASAFLAKLPKDSYVIFHCTAGSRSLEAWQKAKKAGFTKAVYLDAAVKCSKSGCTFTPNEALEPTDW